MRNDSDDIRRYREGSLTDAERHALEKRALGDPFLADALEGTESISAEELRADLKEFSSVILSQEKKPVFTPVRIAAGVVIVLGASLFYFFDQADPQPIALQEKNVQAAGDSVKVSHDTSQLLTMAKPEEQAAGAASTQPSVRLDKSGESSKGKTLTQKPSETTAGPEAIADADDARAEKTEAEEVLLAEEKEARTAEDKKIAATEAVPTISATEAAGGLAARDKTARRSEVSKSAAGLTKNINVDRRTVSGTVTSVGDGSPLPGVNVVIKGTSAGTVTDANGRYTLSMPAENSELVFSYIGLLTNEVQTGKKEVVDVQLGEDVSQLSEVVVVGYGRSSALDEAREPVVIMAAPVGGLRAYNKYLETNLHYPEQALEYKVKGKVTIMFTVETTGQLSDFNVVKGLGHGCDEEVIRLVKEGPKWSPSTKDNVPLESEVRVKLKFDPATAGK